MSDVTYENQALSPQFSLFRTGILIFSAFLIGADTGHLLPNPSHTLLTAGIIGLIFCLTLCLFNNHQNTKVDQEKTHRTESRLEKHVESLSSSSIHIADSTLIKN